MFTFLLAENMNPLIFPRNRTTAVLQKYLWHYITRARWFAINQRNQAKYFECSLNWMQRKICINILLRINISGRFKKKDFRILLSYGSQRLVLNIWHTLDNNRYRERKYICIDSYFELSFLNLRFTTQG